MQAVMDALNESACYSEIRTPEPSLAMSSDMAFQEFRDTIDDFDESKNTTTLEGSSGEYETNATWGLPPPEKQRSILVPMTLLVGLLFGGWGAWTVLERQSADDEEPQAVTTISQPTTPQAIEPPIIIRELVEVPVEVDFVNLLVESDPEGARIYRLADGVEIGRTPMTVKVRQGDGTMSFLLRKTGYKNAKIDLGVARDATEHVKLRSRSKSKPQTAEEPAVVETSTPPTTSLQMEGNTRSAAVNEPPVLNEVEDQPDPL